MEDVSTIHRISIPSGVFPQRVESGDLLEFEITDQIDYDVFQVYRSDDDERFSPVNNGLELIHLNRQTSVNERRLTMSFELTEEKIDLYFCWIPSNQRRKNDDDEKECPKENRIELVKSETKVSLTDQRESQQICLHQGETLQVSWSSKRGQSYRIEEKHYCPISGGLYTVDQSTSTSSKGMFVKRFDQFGMSFLFRLTENNQIHDILVCTINKKHSIKHRQLKNNDDDEQTSTIVIEQNDSIVFQWNTEEKLHVQIDQFVGTDQPSSHGYLQHRFEQLGFFFYKINDKQPGRILVQPKTHLHRFAVFGEQLSESF